MFTIRVMLETVNPQNCLTCSHKGEQILDTFVVVNEQIAFGKLVDTVLKDLGMSHLISESKGLIQINNWKPLLFSQITDNFQQPISKLLKNISSNLILKILTQKTVSNSKTQFPVVSIKSNESRIHSFSGTVAPIQLSNPLHGIQNASESPFIGRASESPFMGQGNLFSDSDEKEATNNFDYENVTSSTAIKMETNELSPNDSIQTSFFSEFTNPLLPPTPLSCEILNTNNTFNNLQPSVSKQSNNISNSNGRSRSIFDLLTEIPMLDQWFQENPHPNLNQIEEYTNILNELPNRKNSSPLTTFNIKIWFKNRRARSKKL